MAGSKRCNLKRIHVNMFIRGHFRLITIVSAYRLPAAAASGMMGPGWGRTAPPVPPGHFHLPQDDPVILCSPRTILLSLTPGVGRIWYVTPPVYRGNLRPQSLQLYVVPQSLRCFSETPLTRRFIMRVVNSA